MSWLDSCSLLFRKAQPERRVATLEMSFDGIAGLLQLDGTYVLKMEGFPEGGKLAFMEADNQRGVVRLYVEHESFPVHLEGSVVSPMPYVTATRFELPSHSAIVAERETPHA